ncbi:MAG: hypothetical protein WC473_01460 [Patescibacteria group bacterium]
MPKKAGNAKESGLTAEQQRELYGAMITATPTDMSRDVYENWMANRRGLNRGVRRLLIPPVEQPQVLPALQHDADTLAQLESWERHYRDEFNMSVDFSGIFIPLRRDWTKRLIVVPQGMTCNQAFAKNAEMFPSWKWTDDLDAAAVKGRNDREPNRHYAIWIRGDVEPDEVAMTANQTRAIGLSGTTLLEPLLLEGKYFMETKDHLNKQKITRCDGSRSAFGYVPCVRWCVGKFRVYCYDPGCPLGNLRPRSVVS